MTNFMNSPEMAKLIMNFEERWAKRAYEYRVNFLTVPPEKLLNTDLICIATKKDFEKLVNNIRGVRMVILHEYIGGSVEFTIWVHSDYCHNEILIETIKYDCRRVIDLFRPSSMHFNLKFRIEDEAYLYRINNPFNAFKESMKKLTEAMFPLESALKKLSQQVQDYGE